MLIVEVIVMAVLIRYPNGRAQKLVCTSGECQPRAAGCTCDGGSQEAEVQETRRAKRAGPQAGEIGF